MKLFCFCFLLLFIYFFFFFFFFFFFVVVVLFVFFLFVVVVFFCCFFCLFFFLFSALAPMFFSEVKQFEHSFVKKEIISKSGHWPTRRCRLQYFVFCSRSGGRLVQRSRTVLALSSRKYAYIRLTPLNTT